MLECELDVMNNNEDVNSNWGNGKALQSYTKDESTGRTQGVHVDYRARSACLTHRSSCQLRG